MKKTSLAVVRLLPVIAVFGGFIGITTPLSAATNTYKGGNNGSWFSASNWSLGHIPLTDEDVVLANGSAVSATGAVSVASINVNGGTYSSGASSDNWRGTFCYLKKKYGFTIVFR